MTLVESLLYGSAQVDRMEADLKQITSLLLSGIKDTRRLAEVGAHNNVAQDDNVTWELERRPDGALHLRCVYWSKTALCHCLGFSTDPSWSGVGVSRTGVVGTIRAHEALDLLLRAFLKDAWFPEVEMLLRPFLHLAKEAARKTYAETTSTT